MRRRSTLEEVPSGRMDALDQLVQLSRYYGSDTGFVVAGGGNTSVKVEDSLYIKASGAQLANVTRDGFVALSRAKVSRLLSASYPAEPQRREEAIMRGILEARLEPDKGQRPSVETILHEVVDRKFVVHVHPTVVNGLTCSKNGKAAAQSLFGQDALWTDYADPGYMLAKKVAAAIDRHRRRTGRTPEVILLQNHGVIIAADGVQALKRLTDKVLKAVRAEIEAKGAEQILSLARLSDPPGRSEAVKRLAPALRGLLAAPPYGGLPLAPSSSLGRVVAYDDSREAAFICSQQGRRLALGGALTPDQIVYCNSSPLWLEANTGEFRVSSLRSQETLDSQTLDSRLLVRLLRAGLDEYVARRGCEPKVILVEGVGLFAVGETPKMAAAAMAAYLDAVKVMAYATAFGGPRFLNQQQAHFIETWESEHYRRRVAALAPSSSLGGDAPPSAEATGDKSGRARGKVVAVTGAAQGLGEGIARDVAAQGACVVIADLNLPRAQKLADELNALHGEGRAFAWRTDVTDGESVREMLWQTVRRFGGIDVLISNAGVLKAGSVKTMSDADFGLVTDVNYRGYFHCVKHAAPVMAAQNACNPGSWTDIIQVNSKSGLVGSNRNAAYAGSKFGGIGLTQSFALELVEDGIKVNSVCPGNLFDSPLWSDPENGLFAQYLRTGKVPGARTVADVRKAYEARVPMRRGCELPDIMAAIYYLIEQKYETGQALPVSGGQVMLR